MMKLFVKYGCTLLLLLLFPACKSTQPSMAFKQNSSHQLIPHTTNTILLPADSFCKLSVEELYFPILTEASIKNSFLGTFHPAGKVIEGEGGTLHKSIGNRELLVTATMYKNGYLSGFEVITDAIGSVVTHHSAPITNPTFFSGKIGSDYIMILFQAFEIDSVGAVRAVRQLSQENLTKFNSNYNLGTALGGGVVKILKGTADILLSVTGSGLDDWVARYDATKVFEHAIIVRAAQQIGSTPTPSILYIVTNNTDNSFMDETKVKPNQTVGDMVRAAAADFTKNNKVSITQNAYMKISASLDN